MRIFFDSSALAKRYVREPGTDAVLSYCAEASEVIVSILLPVEVLSSLNRLLREKRLTPRIYHWHKATGEFPPRRPRPNTS